MPMNPIRVLVRLARWDLLKINISRLKKVVILSWIEYRCFKYLFDQYIFVIFHRKKYMEMYNPKQN